MALLPCRECGRQVSTEAPFCPQCGVPNPTRGMQPSGSPAEAVAPTPPPLSPSPLAEPGKTSTPAVPRPSSPAWSAPAEQKSDGAWTPLVALGALVVLVAIIGITVGDGASTGSGTSSFVGPSGSEAAEKTRDSTRSAGIHARIVTASRSDLADLDWIEHRWSLPHDSTVHARAQTAILDSAEVLLKGKSPTAAAVLAQVRHPLTPRQKERNERLTRRSSVEAEAASRAAAAASAKATDAAKWSYSSHTDEMTGRTSRSASIQSENTVNFDFPYQGAQHATLMLRNHPSYGRDIIVGIREGQILCPSYDDCTVRVRFDDGSSERWTAAGAADHSTTHIFLRASSRFVERMKNSSVVRIQIPVYQEGSPTFEFRVGGYDHARYTRGN